MTEIKITTHTVGQSFGTQATARLGDVKATGDVVSYGHDAAARASALRAVLEAAHCHPADLADALLAGRTVREWHYGEIRVAS
jgi:hypothetical protein